MWTTRPRTRRKWRQTSTPSCRERDNRRNRRDSFRIIYSVILAACMAAQEARAAKCPPPDTIPGCPCYNFENGGLFLECAGATEDSLRNALSGVIHVAGEEGALVQSLSVYELDRKVEELRSAAFPAGSQIRHLQISHSAIREINEDAFQRLSKSLESLALVSGRLPHVPQKAMATLSLLKALDLEANLVYELPSFSFYGLSLIKLNLKGNQIMKISEYAFAGLETTLKDLDLAENKIRVFPMTSLRRLEHLTSLRLAWNEVSQLPEDGYSRLIALNFLDLSSNNFKDIPLNCFRCCPSLKTLSLYYNAVESVDKDAFISLIDLESIDLSHNKIVFLDVATFRANQKLRSIDLSHNHIHYIRGLNLEHNHFTAMALDRLDIPGLRVLRISYNNFSQINANSLDGLPSLQHLAMESSQIHKISAEIFSKNKNLGKLLLSNNLLRILPATLFLGLEALKEVKLDGNRFQEIPYDVFANATTIEFLSLANNILSHVDMSRLNGLISLRELDLRSNYITSLNGFAAVNFSRLISVDLSHNHLKALPANFFARSNMLRKIELAANKFRQIPAVALTAQNIPNLAWLNVTANPLVRIHEISSEAKYPALQEIHISGTNLTIVTSQDFEAFPALMHLFMGSNMISRVSPSAFRNLPNLLTLDLSVNELELLPQERLKGLEHLRLLNLTHNHLKELEDFPPDLKALQVLDLSYNQISGVGRSTFQHLESLAELHLYGNWISSISSDAFKPLKKLRILDLSRNYLANLPLNAFRPLETQIRSLRAEENPLHCDCDSQELWEWLRDHQKLVGGGMSRNRGGGLRMNDMDSGLLRCEQPPELRGLVFLDLDPRAFCSAPLILKLAIQDIQPFSVLVSWQSRNHSSLRGYQVAYHALDIVDEVRAKILEPSSRSVKLSKLSSNTRYLICVFGLGNWITSRTEDGPIEQLNFTQIEILASTPSPQMKDSTTSRCTEVKTLDAPDAIISSDGSAMGDVGSVSSFLTRRLGLIVGCCMGFVVFLLLVSVLGYLKVKKQREAVKREQQPIPPEYISYRHFSIQSGEAGHAAARQTSQDGQHPNFISNTTLNV
ncbi:Insulin-like growth factor-binding protein complex acid labile chain [Camponotus floridanus]|uniref:Insulin-like growth factor-binding protein complex acid labile chain n=1 Tax=Camponotus floridanus TaxID=104421 RepID=E2APT3_CAMFO|nr:Insulin-like growth factor-binding protein complex acid labile chain [Camponotus floridanus]